jgi:hypothetical protein
MMPSENESQLNIDPITIVSRVFTGVGFVMLMVVLLMLWFDRKQANNSTEVKGTVTSLDYNSSGTAAPVIGYRFSGKKRYFRGSVASNPPSFEVGEEVELLVSNKNPDDVIINSFFERYFAALLIGFLGFAFGGIGLAMIIFMKK